MESPKIRIDFAHCLHETENERFSVLELGMGGIRNAPESKIERMVRAAVDHGTASFSRTFRHSAEISG